MHIYKGSFERVERMMMLFTFCFCLLFVGKVSSWDNEHTITGQVFYSLGLPVSIPRHSYILVEIEDSTLKTQYSRTFANYIARATIFPVVFNISYAVTNVVYGHVYVINAKLFNEFHEILFRNQQVIEVKLLGKGRTRFIDIPVLAVQRMINRIGSIE